MSNKQELSRSYDVKRWAEEAASRMTVERLMHLLTTRSEQWEIGEDVDAVRMALGYMASRSETQPTDDGFARARYVMEAKAAGAEPNPNYPPPTDKNSEQFLRTTEPRECPACWGNGYMLDRHEEHLPCSICAETGKVVPYVVPSATRQTIMDVCDRIGVDRAEVLRARGYTREAEQAFDTARAVREELLRRSEGGAK